MKGAFKFLGAAVCGAVALAVGYWLGATRQGYVP